LSDAQDLKTAIDDFTANPSASLLEDAKQAWLKARESYGQTEAFRFANGPIDDADGPEGLLNAWPLDEGYIDYVEGAENSGIINDLTNYPNLDEALLESLNESGGDKNISIGYHAIEFLLWGQDLTAPSEKKAGLRPFTDYTTKSNASRRAQYLKLSAAYLVSLLDDLKDEWKPNATNNYRAELLKKDPSATLSTILQSIGILAQSELGGERVLTAYNAKDQEEEHSCFSDNTHRDIVLNAQGVKNVFTGSYKKNDGTTVSGKSIADLLKSKDQETYDLVMSKLDKALSSAEAIPAPFDLAISDETQRPLVFATYNDLQELGDAFVVAGNKLGFSINTNLPD
jgi:putative iron-regulated protein